MKEEKCDKCCTCNLDFNEDNGYRYVLDELKRIRDDIDNTISVIEKRMEKDAIINKVLNTDYEDEKDDKKEKETSLDSIIKAIAIRNALNFPYNNNTRIVYPYSNHLWNENTWY